MTEIEPPASEHAEAVATPEEIRAARYFLVVDLEATCDDAGRVPQEQMETIEIGAVLVDAGTLAPAAEFQAFVQPVRHRTLTPFCTKLTGISQDMVATARMFPTAFRDMKKQLAFERTRTVFGSWGGFDRHQFVRDCRHHGLAYDLPPHWNLKTAFAANQSRRKSCGMAAALKLAGLPLEGRHHRGIDDARNIARLLPWIIGDRRVT